MAETLFYAVPSDRRKHGRWLIVVTAAVAGVLSLVLSTAVAVKYRKQQAARQVLAAIQMQRVAQMTAVRQRLSALLEACQAYSPPRSTVVFDDSPARAAALLRSGRGYVPVGPGTEMGPACLVPGCWRDLRHSFRYLDADTAEGHGTYDAGIAFLHERTAPNGARRLVQVGLGEIAAKKYVFKAHWFRPAPYPTALVARQPKLGVFLRPGDRFRVFAGQTDPDDPSHFTIDYEVNDHHGVIDGWLLRGEGFLSDERIRLQPREGRVDGTRAIPLWFPEAAADEPLPLPAPVWP